MRAAVTKSLLDRLFFPRFELWNGKKIFVELFHKDNFFVLVCGPFLLIKNFVRCKRKRLAVGIWQDGKMSAFLLQSFAFRPPAEGGSII